MQTFKNAFANSESMNVILKYERLTKSWLASGLFLASMAAFAASSKAILVKLIYAQATIAPITVLFLRLLIALPFFIWLARLPKLQAQEVAPLTWPTMLVIAWLGFTGYYFSSFADFTGLSYISASLERLLLFTYPGMVLLISCIWYRRWPSPKLLSALMLSYLGLVAAFTHDLTHTENTENLWRGVGWVLLSSFSFAIYYLSAPRPIAKLGSRRFAGLAGIAAFGFTFLHFTATQNPMIIFQLPLEVWLLSAVMAILCTLLPSLFMSAAIAKIGSEKTANVSTLGPVLTLVLAWVILGESMSGLQILGLVLVILGVSRLR